MEDLRKLVATGREAYENKEFTRAEELLSRALEIRDDLADVHNMLGVIYHNVGEMDKAKGHFERALIINPNYTDAALNLSVTYNDLGKYGEARKVYSRAMAQSKNQPSSLDPFVRGKLSNMHADLAEVYKELTLYDEAITEFEKALALAPTFIDIRTRLADVYREKGDYDKALSELETVITTNKKYTPALISMGVVYYSKTDMDKAREYFEEVLKFDPNNKSCNLYLKMIERAAASQDNPNS